MSDGVLVPVTGLDGTIDERETVFQTWSMIADRNSVETSRLVKERFGMAVPASTVRTWANRYGWDERAIEFFRDVAPTYYQRSASRLVGAAPEAANYLARVIAGSEGEGGLNLVDKGRVAAAFGVLDRVGFLPNTRKEAERHGTPVTGSSSSDETWVTMDEDQLRKAIAARLTGDD